MEMVLNKLKMRLPALLVLVATLLFWGLYDRYESIGPPILESPSLVDAFRVRGDCSETNGIFSLNVPDGGKIAEVRFRIADVSEYSYLRLFARIRTQDVVRGKHIWNSARLILIQRNANDKWIPSDHRLLSEDGTTEWTQQVNEFEVEPDAVLFEVVLQQIGKSGRADFDRIIAQPVRVRSSFIWFRVFFSAVWVGMAALYFRRCRLDHRRLRILIILNAFVILYGTLMPSEWISDASSLLKDRFAQSVQKADAEIPASSGKDKPVVEDRSVETKRIHQFSQAVDQAHQAGHFLLFASLCFLVYCSAWLEQQHPMYYFKVGLDILLFAAVSESLQFLTLDRMPGIHDWLMDVYGMALALGVFLVVRLITTLFPKSGKT